MVGVNGCHWYQLNSKLLFLDCHCEGVNHYLWPDFLLLSPEAISQTPNRKIEIASDTELLEKTTFTELEIGDIVKSLQRHDVIEEKDNKYTIIVELFRQWVTDKYYVVQETNT